MILFPAIDVMEGRAVRLYKGEREQMTDYGDPLAFAEKWVQAGAKWLHVVDLSGAFSGEGGIEPLIREIKKRFAVKVQSGGGLRKLSDIARRLEAGADRVIVGTMAVADPDSFALAAYEYKDKIVAGIDAKGGMLAVRGWTETTDVSAVAFGKQCRRMGISCALFTDISRDGAMRGVNVAETVRLQKETGLDVIASGGVASAADIKNLSESGVYGAILGKALYEGALTLQDAEDAARG